MAPAIGAAIFAALGTTGAAIGATVIAGTTQVCLRGVVVLGVRQ